MSHRPLLNRVTLGEALVFAAGRTIAREMEYGEGGVVLPGDHQGGVLFTDGSALVCVTEYGFLGSDLTPPDPVQVAFYVYESTPQTPR